MTPRFDQPVMLWLLLLAVPLLVMGVRSMRGMDRVRRISALGLRTALFIIMVLMLAAPRLDREHDHLTVIGVIDVSGSVRRFVDVPPHPEAGLVSAVEYVRQWFRHAASQRDENDRFGLVVFDGEATAVAVPTRVDYVDDNLDSVRFPGTSIAEGIGLALAMFPADTARRLVLVSDGNETRGSAVDAALQAAGAAQTDTGQTGIKGSGVPIDVLPLEYRTVADAQVLRVESPANAQPGQTITVRILLEASATMAGTLTLRHEQVTVDINGSQPGRARRITVPSGQSAHLAQVRLGRTPVNRFEAIFEPDPRFADVLPENNRAEAFTATPSQGTVLIVDSQSGASRGGLLRRALETAELPLQLMTAEEFPQDLLSLQNYDLIVMNNVGAFEITSAQQTLLSHYVNDLGGGLIMIGGENGFGAGGWNKTPVADVLPLRLDPPREMRLPSAALVLVLDKSGSMNRAVAGARATQQRVANEAAALAVESLRSDSMVGVVTFDFVAHELVPLQRNDDPNQIVRRLQGIQADGGTDLRPALRMAYDMLRDVKADKKRVVCLTDGRSESGDLEFVVRAMVDADIKLTTIAVGDDADRETLERLAEIGGGTYYAVRNPRTLPRVMVDSVQVVNKPLIKEIPFTPVVQPTGSSLVLDMGNAPELQGLIITAPREDAPAVIELTHPDGEPLLAHWQAGLGRAAAFTSDMSGAWSTSWDAWPAAAQFWTQLVRLMARPATSQDYELITQIEGNVLVIVLEAAGETDGFMEYLQVGGAVYGPSGDAQTIRLRQTAPGRYAARVDAPEPGNYIVALNPRLGNRNLSPVIGGATQTNNPEYRRYTPNPTLLKQIADMTGGRELDLRVPIESELFSRAGMPTSISSMPVWRDLVLISLALLLLDIAARRLAWSGAMIRRLAARAVASVTPAHVRGGAAAATLASLREASARVDQRYDMGVEKLEAPEDTAVPVDRTVPADAAPEPTPSRVSAALNALLGRRGVRPIDEAPVEPVNDGDEPVSQPPAIPSDDKPGDEFGSTETTSSLLAAKRRARDRLGGDSS